MMSMIVSRAPGWEPTKKQQAVAPEKKKANPATTNNGATTPTPTPALVPESNEAAGGVKDI